MRVSARVTAAGDWGTDVLAGPAARSSRRSGTVASEPRPVERTRPLHFPGMAPAGRRATGLVLRLGSANVQRGPCPSVWPGESLDSHHVVESGGHAVVAIPVRQLLARRRLDHLSHSDLPVGLKGRARKAVCRIRRASRSLMFTSGFVLMFSPPRSIPPARIGTPTDMRRRLPVDVFPILVCWRVSAIPCRSVGHGITPSNQR